VRLDVWLSYKWGMGIVFARKSLSISHTYLAISDCERVHFRPIQTYSGQATLKPNLPDRHQHAIIYTSSECPEAYWYTANDGTVVREDLSKDPIKVRSEQDGHDGDLGKLSRINYSKIYTVEHYVRVLNIGMVDRNSIPSLKANSMIYRETPVEKPLKHPSKSEPSHHGKSKGGKGKGKRH